MMRYLFIACALSAACGADSPPAADVSQFLGAWQITGGGGSWQCSDGGGGTKSPGEGEYTITPDTTGEIIATTPSGCTAVFDVSGNRAAGTSLVCQGKPYPGTWMLTLVASNHALTWTDTTSWLDGAANCNETDTTFLAPAAAK